MTDPTRPTLRNATPLSEPSAPIPELVSVVYSQAEPPLRAKLLECLVRPVGTLALAAIATGAFNFLLFRPVGDTLMSVEDAARIAPDQVLDLARFVEQSSPDTLLQIGTLIADSPIGVATISGAALLIALAAWRRRTSRPAV